MIESNYRRISEQIGSIADNRPVKLIGVTKTVPVERIVEACNAGLRCFGENRIQEALPKIQSLPNDLEWHFIGHLQSNKEREAVRSFSWIQSVDSLRLLNIIEKEAAKQDKRIPVLLELNLGGEQTKHGLEPSELDRVLLESRTLRWVQIRGLMTIPPYYEDPEQVRPFFRRLRELASQYPGLTELSMGMSHDYAVAIEEGATMVRIGTALFGERPR